VKLNKEMRSKIAKLKNKTENALVLNFQ